MSAQHKEPMLNIGEMSEMLGFKVTEEFLSKLSFKPSAPDSLAKLYKESDFSGICRAISEHVIDLSMNPMDQTWTASFTALDGDSKEWFVTRGDGNPVAKTYGTWSHKTAHLIAAAPDLLAAVKSFYLWAENQADGQSKGGHATFDLLMLREQRDIAAAAIAKAEGGAA